MEPITEEQIAGGLAQLEQAIYAHEQWWHGLNTTLICRLEPDDRDVREDGHHHCRFGQWYDRQASDRLRLDPGFIALGEAHEHMHRVARKLLLTSHAGGQVTLPDYQNFLSTYQNTRMELLELKLHLEDMLANRDPLTGAASRVGLLTKLREEREFVRRNAYSCVIAMMDVDHFKTVNDTRGHQAGDRVLVEVVERMLRHLRSSDKLFRYGGDEFLLCAPNTDLAAAMLLVERLRTEVAAASEANSEGGGGVTMSFGVAPLDGQIPVEESIARADRALLAAKQGGKNCVAIWDPSMR
jgi:diguanylate cyclase